MIRLIRGISETLRNWKENIMAKGKYTDFPLIIVVVLLIFFGLMMIYSASYFEASKQFGNPNYYFNKQLTSVAIGAIAMLFAMGFDYRYYYRFSGLVFIVSIVLVFMLLIPEISITANGATRWIKIFGFSLQPAEVVKLSVIMINASWFVMFRNELKDWRILGFTMIPTVIGVITVGFVSNNMSSAIIVLLITIGTLFIATRNYRTYLAGAFASACMVVGIILWVLNSEGSNFRFGRIRAWLDLEAYANKEGYQTLQSLYAIGTGGFWGKGLGESVQKLGFLPEAQNDMIFSIICEELGFFGASVVIVLFYVLIYRAFYIARNARDMFGCMLATGIMVHFAVQIVLNFMVVIGLVPNTGVSLPFISYGGSSVVFLMFEIGMLINISHGIRVRA